MADNSCGGSTPFKRIVDQQNRDGSNQQDRLIANAGPSGNQSFRSAPLAPQNQAQDAAFNNFMAGSGPVAAPTGWQGPAARVGVHAAAMNPVLHHHAPPMVNQPAVPVNAAHNQQIAVGVSSWANDFAQYNAALQQQQQAAASGTQVPAGQAIAHHHLEHPLIPHGPVGNSFMQPNFGMQPVYGPTNGGFQDPAMAAVGRSAREADFNNELNKWMEVHGDANATSAHAKAMEDVDAIMEQIARELERQQDAPIVAETASAAPVNSVDTSLSAPLQQPAQEQTPLSHTLHHDHSLTDLGVPEMQNLTITAAEQRNATTTVAPVIDTEENVEAGPDQPKIKSEVAIAAERLLDSVKDEGGEKWQQSTFLALMRDFRDGKKDVVGNEVRDTNEPGGQDDGKGKGPDAPGPAAPESG